MGILFTDVLNNSSHKHAVQIESDGLNQTFHYTFSPTILTVLFSFVVYLISPRLVFLGTVKI